MRERSDSPKCGSPAPPARLCQPQTRRFLASEFKGFSTGKRSDGAWHPGCCAKLPMTGMRSRAFVFVALLLALAAGQCFIDQGDDHWMSDGMMLDLCLMMVVVVSIAPILLAGPLLSGWADAYPPLMLAPAPVRVLDPPPKRAPRS